MLRVLVVDDSAVVRQIIRVTLTNAGFHVETAPDAIIALRKIESKPPDAILLDIELPQMDGLSFLEKLRQHYSIPVVVCSGHAEEGSEMAQRARQLGVAAIFAKPKMGVKDYLSDSTAQIIQVLRQVTAKRHNKGAPRPAESYAPARAVPVRMDGREPLVVIGASTGGTEALATLLATMPAGAPAIAIVQHMPHGFTKSFAERLNGLSAMTVREAVGTEPLQRGTCLIAPGDRHMRVRKRGHIHESQLLDGPAVSRHKPSVDVLFLSASELDVSRILGVIMTGMGKDGAAGMKAMHDRGATTYGQDESSCVVFGMPKEAHELGAVDHLVPLNRLPQAIMDWAQALEVRPNAASVQVPPTTFTLH